MLSPTAHRTQAYVQANVQWQRNIKTKLTLWRALPLKIVGSSHPTQSTNKGNGMYPSYTSKKQGGEPSEEAQDTSSTSQPDHHNTTQLSSTTTSCVGQRLLGTHLKIGGTLNDQRDQIIVATSLKTKYRQQDRWDL